MADDSTSVVSSSRPTSPSPSNPVENDSVGPLPGRRAAPGPYRFHWDPTASRRQGPPSVSEGTEGRLDYSLDVAPNKIESIFDTASGSTALPQAWSSSQHGFNAISTVLNNPHSKPNPLKSSRAPIFSGPHPDLPRLRRKDFDPYLKAIGPEWQRFQENQRAREIAQERGDEIFSPNLVTEHGEASVSTPRLPKKPPPPPLDLVPQIYFEKDFNLGDVRTFAAVTEQPDGEGGASEDPNVNQDLQDKLSQCLDIVEQHLTIEVQARSSSFFAALSNLQSLQAEGSECLMRITNLRQQLVEVDEKQAKRGLQITRLTKKRDNLRIVEEGVEAIHAVGESISLVKNLVGTGEYFEALAMIEQLGSMFDKPSQEAPVVPTTNERPPKPQNRIQLPLGSISALASLPASLQELSKSIATSLSADLVALLRVALTRDQEPTSAESTEITTVERINPLLQGLVKTGGIEQAVAAYQDVVLNEIKACVRKHLPKSEWDEDELSSEVSATHNSPDISKLSHDEFKVLAKTMYSTLLSRINTTASHITAITSVISTLVPPPDDPHADLPSPTLGTLLSTATELANARASKVMSLRSAQHSQLPLQSFLEIFNMSWSFVVKCEVLTRRMVVGLRGILVGQAKAWLMTFHSDRTSRLARAVEEEVWGQVEVSGASQRVVDVIVDAAVGNPKELIIITERDPLSETPQTNGAPNGHPDAANGVTSPEKPSAKLLKIEERTYFVVAATMEVLELLMDYLKVIVNIPLLTTDAMSRIIEYLKAFNSRTCQVVLGAGAMRSAGLKNITAKHLALASQSLSIMIALVPYIRETLRRHLNPKQAVILVEFDKLKRDYQEHQNEIHAKLIAIMGDRLSVHCKSLSEIQWDQPPAKAGPNTYMEVLVKETVTLHKVLSKYLAEQSVELIMTQVFAAVNHRLSEEYGKIELPSQEAKTRLLTDAKYLHEKLSNLKGVNLPSSMLETVVMEKSVPRKGSPFPSKHNSDGIAPGNANRPLPPSWRTFITKSQSYAHSTIWSRTHGEWRVTFSYFRHTTRIAERKSKGVAFGVSEDELRRDLLDDRLHPHYKFRDFKHHKTPFNPLTPFSLLLHHRRIVDTLD
ncbi:hypothetical protein FS837_011927 [Tulasnella sp. UAMH 9824]|nr:hypothetical protein FS837_011927 [Tulasnella sp. UAMH 9824]